jgi:hypothetical protein
MSSLPEGESTDGGKAPSTGAKRSSARDLDTDSTNGHTLYQRQRRLRGLVLAVLAGAVLLLIMAGIRKAVRQVRETSDVSAPTNSSSPASQSTTAVETPTDQRREPSPPSPPAVAPSAKASPGPQPRHHRAPLLPRQKRGTFPRPTN